VLFALAGLYLATWIWGVPAVHTAIAKGVIRDYKEALRNHWDVWEVHPMVHYSATYVLAPMVIVTYYDYSVASLFGWGGFTIDLWWPGGTKTITGHTSWIS
jgi:hypothetical protein